MYGRPERIECSTERRPGRFCADCNVEPWGKSTGMATGTVGVDSTYAPAALAPFHQPRSSLLSVARLPLPSRTHLNRGERWHICENCVASCLHRQSCTGTIFMHDASLIGHYASALCVRTPQARLCIYTASGMAWHSSHPVVVVLPSFQSPRYWPRQALPPTHSFFNLSSPLRG